MAPRPAPRIISPVRANGRPRRRAACATRPSATARAHRGAGDKFAVDHHRFDDLDRESEALPQLRERLDIALLAMAEAKILADQDGRRLQFLDQHAANEIPGTERGQGAIKAQDERGFQSDGGELLHSLVHRFHHGRRLARTQHFQRMRIEGDYGGDALELLGALDHLAKDFLVAEVQAIEIADGKHGASSGRAVSRRPLHRGTQHGASAHAATSKLRPS